MNCAITRGELSCAKSSRMPHYVLETWINDNASSRIQLCQMAVTLRRMMAAISLAEKQCANRNNIVNIVEIAVKQNQTLNTTIDTEMFSESFDGAPMSIPSYHIDKFYLEEASASALYPKTLAMCSCDNHLAVIHEEVVVILQYIHEMRELDGAILVFLPDWLDLVKVQNLLYPSDNVVVHLVSSQSLNDSELHDIHSKPPPGKRKIILATDIAQSFISIDDLVYVVDTGMRKCEFFDIEQGINVFDLEWISRANANQRVGLTGSLGESYHFSLYTEERYRMFVD
ncbi:unnamed protein product [Ceutorhynchus assimilis]|uniref:Helicase C-terminal domain-containing protein n=1 Tax=Ceutorhynchus assimilis TaxID=467358 RepID=A0A9N9QLZ2_9CUCU|nr:unnamed protein product [Ceutorhynchus assimilis]